MPGSTVTGTNPPPTPTPNPNSGAAITSDLTTRRWSYHSLSIFHVLIPLTLTFLYLSAYSVFSDGPVHEVYRGRKMGPPMRVPAHDLLMNWAEAACDTTIPQVRPRSRSIIANAPRYQKRTCDDTNITKTTFFRTSTSLPSQSSPQPPSWT